MPKIPISKPIDSSRCDPRLPLEALAYRKKQNPPLVTYDYLRAFNITVWLYRDRQGVQGVHVTANITIEELIRKFGPAETPDAEVGIHSEGIAGEWFLKKPHLTVLQIFTERIPCPNMCAPMLTRYFPEVPWYYYYDRRSWINKGSITPIKSAADILKSAYEL